MRPSLIFAFLASSAFLSLQGCAATAADDVAVGDETAASQDELTSSAQRLVGAFHLANATPLPPTFDGIAFNANGEFFADVDTGIRCVVAPCPSNVRLTGKFTATRTFLTLTPAAGEKPSDFYGKYRYTLDGDQLTLKRDGAKFAQWSNTLDSGKGSYCAEASDCNDQMLIVPACVGHFTCSEQRTCRFACGVAPVSQVWPIDSKELVAENRGGGFVAPPPSGSTCAVGAAKFALSTSTRMLSWQTCEFVDGALHMVKGKRTISATELKKVDAAMNEVTVSTREMCGADKPFLSLQVTSASQGMKSFADSFYSCQGGDETYVDNIDGVFSALRDLAH